MNDKEKLEALKAYLSEKGIKFKEDARHTSKNILIELFIPKYLIGVHIGDSPEWFNQVKRYLHPVFIREADTADFVIEKVVNTIQKAKNNKKRCLRQKKDPSQLSPGLRKMLRHRRNRTHKFLQEVMGEDKPADTAPEAPAKPKRARVRIAASPVKVGSSKL